MVRRLGLDRMWGGDPARLWRAVRIVLAPILAWLGRGSVAYGCERIPDTGGVLVAANHFTALDPALVGGLARRPIHFFAKSQLFRRSLLTEAILWLGAIPVGHHASSRAALHHASALLRAGRVVGVFVEGARQRSEGMGEAMPGAALLALRTGAPVVPCGVDTFGWSRRRRRPCVAVFGPPVTLADLPPGRGAVDEATARIAAAIEAARREAVDANAAGRPPRLRDGAGRRGWRDTWLDAVSTRARP